MVYCDFRNAPAEATRADQANFDVEIMDQAVSTIRPDDSSSPFAQGLMAGLDYICFMVVGAGIGFVGLVVEKGRRATITAPTPTEPDLTGKPE